MGAPKTLSATASIPAWYLPCTAAAREHGPLLRNPYHGAEQFGGRPEWSHTWFHGTRDEPDFGTRRKFSDEAQRAALPPEQREMNFGWTQPNQHLGVHFSPLHEVAHKFVGSVSSTPGSLVHARLRLSNPAVFDSEEHLNIAMADWAGKHYPHWHNDRLNGSMAWNYSDQEGTHRDFSRVPDDPGERYRASQKAQALLQWHPHMPEILAGFRQHLRDQGHHGIIYGNGLEGPYETDAGRGGEAAMKYIRKRENWPRGNPYSFSAIAQPEDIEVTHVERIAPWRKEPQGDQRTWEDASDNDEPDDMRDKILDWHRQHGGKLPFRLGARADDIGPVAYSHHEEEPGSHRFDAHDRWGNNVGYAQAYEKPDHVFLDAVYVVPGARGHGIAGRLVDNAVSRFPGRPVRLRPEPFADPRWPSDDTGPDEDELRDFYGRHGFEDYYPKEGDEPGSAEHMVRHGAAHWVPSSGIFAPTTGLDPRLFTESGEIRPDVTEAIVTRLDTCIRTDAQVAGSEWQQWARVYVAGGSASEWAGSRPNDQAQDLDVLVGVDFAKARYETDALKPLSDDQIAASLNAAFRHCFNETGWRAPFGGVWDLTAYCNPGSWDITAIKPYAAYEIWPDMHWAVKPPHLPEHTLADFDPATLSLARAVLAEARAILRLPEPLRTREAKALWERIHAERSQAFSGSGGGWTDPGNVTEKWLAYAPHNELGKIRELALAKTATTGSCEYCGDGGHPESEHCEYCGERDHQGSEVEFHAPELIQPWHHILPGVSSIHRAMALRLDPADHAIVHDQSRPQEERARHLLSLVSRQPLGMHWASDRGQEFAEEFARPDHAPAGTDPDRATGVMVHAHTPHPSDVEDDPERLFREKYWSYGEPEFEIPMKEDAPVGVTGISWRQGRHGEWTHHQFGRLHQLTASIQPKTGPSVSKTAAVGGASLGELYHSTPYSHGFPYDDWMHVGTRAAAENRARQVRPEDYGFPADHPTTMHTVRLRGRVYPHALTNELADEVWGAGHTRGLADEGLPGGDGYHVFPYHDNAEGGALSYLVHRSAIVPVRTETIPRGELVPRTTAREEQLAAMDHNTRASALAQEHTRYWHPRTTLPLSEHNGQNNLTMTRWLTEAGVPRADESYVARHNFPDLLQSSTARGPDGEPGVALHPERWDYGTMAHETAHLIHDHQTGRPFRGPEPEGGTHNDRWAAIYAGLLNQMEPEAGDTFLARRREHLGLSAEAAASQEKPTRTKDDPEIRYSDTAGTAKEHCGNCVMVRLLPPDFESGHCTLVKGLVNAKHGRCKKWYPDKDQKTAAVTAATAPGDPDFRDHIQNPCTTCGGPVHFAKGLEMRGRYPWKHHSPLISDHQAVPSDPEDRRGSSSQTFGGTHCLMCHEPVQVNLAALGTETGGWHHGDGMKRDHPAIPADPQAVYDAIPVARAQLEQARRQVADDMHGKFEQLSGHPLPPRLRGDEDQMPPDPFTASLRTGDQDGPADHGGSWVDRARTMVSGVAAAKGHDLEWVRNVERRRAQPEGSAERASWIARCRNCSPPKSGYELVLPDDPGEPGGISFSKDYIPAYLKRRCRQTHDPYPDFGGGRAHADAIQRRKDEAKAAETRRQQERQTWMDKGASDWEEHGRQVVEDRQRQEDEAWGQHQAVSGYSGVTGRSAMIYLELPEGLIRHVPGGVDDHHITLVYLGKNVNDTAWAEAVLRAQAAAQRAEPLSGVLRGVDTFDPDERGKVPAFVPAYIPGIGKLRQSLEDLSASEYRHYRPHVTLAYLDPDEDLPAAHPAVKVRFTRLYVKRGDEVVSFPLGTTE